MVVSALSTFAIWAVPKKASIIVILSCVFTGFSTIGWIALDVIVPDLFAVHLRYVEIKQSLYIVEIKQSLYIVQIKQSLYIVHFL